MFELGHCVDGVWRQFSHPAVFTVERTKNNEPTLFAAAPGSDLDTVREMVTGLNAPLFLLYVPHTPRGEGRAGRYQRGSMNHASFIEFLAFRKFFPIRRSFRRPHTSGSTARSPTDGDE
jgi:hypothetical protein